MAEKSLTIEDLADHVGIKPGDLDKKFSEKHLAKFAKCIANWEQFARPLGLSDQQVMEIRTDSNLNQEMKTVKMLEKWRKKNAFRATYKKVITICLELDDAELAIEVCELIKDDINSKSDSNAELEKAPHSGTQTVLLERLRGVLLPMRQFPDTECKTATVKEFVLDFVSTSIKSDQSYDGVESILHTLHKEELLFSEEVLKEASTVAEKEYTQREAAAKSSGSKSFKTQPKEPLFSKDTIYHADLCCRILAEGDAGNYQSLFKKLPNGQGHSFRAVSMSRSKTERLLIAEQGNSLIYFAFESRPQLSDWKNYKSFDEGVTLQSQQFPVRYIVELLTKQYRIVLTGFSFGGLLANCVTAMVWDMPYINSDLLKENLVCITFGKPLVSIKLAQSVAKRRPDISSTIHSIQLEGDSVPYLMSFLDVSWSAQELSESKNGSQNVMAFTANTPLQDPSTSSIMDTLQKVQLNCPNSVDALGKLKLKLTELQLKLPQLPSLPETDYHIYCDPEDGLVFKLVVNSKVKEQFIKMLSLDSLDEGLFKTHCSAEYSKAIFDSHLDKELKYFIPPAPKHAPQVVENLLPSVSEVHVHHHGDQTAIAIEGTNLWFCREVSLLGHKQSIPPSITSGSSIHINIPTKKLTLGDDVSGKQSISAVLFTPFSSKSIKQDCVPLYIKGFGVTTRQEQLAKLSPSKVIELAYLSALLEQNPSGEDTSNSHKFEVIVTFLKGVSKVVPFESIGYAIAYSNFETALTCYKALVESKIEPPPTFVMHRGLFMAKYRMQYGLPPQVIIDHTYNAQQAGARDTYWAAIHTDENSDSDLVLSSHATESVFTHPLCMDTISSDRILSERNTEAGRRLGEMCEPISDKCKANNCTLVISDLTIDTLYPIQNTESHVLTSPIDILIKGRAKLSQLAVSPVGSNTKQTVDCNKQMLCTLNGIRQTDLEVCTSLLGGFMEQQDIAIALVKSQKDSTIAFGLKAAASVGVWALFSLDYDQIRPILTQCDKEKLLVKIIDFVKNISGITDDSNDTSYAAKLQFMTVGMAKTVTCNTRYISYSLERQLVDLCKERSIDASISLSDLQNKWGALFKGKTLSLVERQYRPLIGRWLKWALMIHNLREELAKYIAIGVTGLVNSGKSKLINTLFGIKVPIGTTEESRTTVPFLYNLDRSVEGLNVVDFPGVDDEDDTIGDLADLLITVAQIILFVVDYRKAHTQSAKKWLERLHKEKVPVLVCLTFGDKLYAERISEKGVHLPKQDMIAVVKDQLSVTEDKLRPTGSHKVGFYSFAQDNDSVLNSEEGRGRLRDVGIGSPLQVGEWLTEVFRRDFDNEQLANQLEPFMSKNASL